ncbi:MAG: hypothetical protein KA223_00590 [Candidatus Accumulibacter sp.]|jgi:hypothetical protein|nr:hypothetical protein [Accumulibacter sp.]
MAFIIRGACPSHDRLIATCQFSFIKLEAMDSAEEELAGADRGVRLLAKRVVQLLNRLVVKPMAGMPGASRDWPRPWRRAAC